MQNHPPIIGRRLIWRMYGVLAAVLIGYPWWAGAPPEKRLLLWGMAVLLGVLVFFMLSISVTEKGVACLTPTGRKTLAWNEIENVSFSGHTFCMTRHKVSVRISLLVFNDADAAYAYILAHLSPALRQKLGLA